MKDISFSQFKQMTVAEIKEEGSFNLTKDGEFFAIVAVPVSPYKKDQLRALCEQMNVAIGK